VRKAATALAGFVIVARASFPLASLCSAQAVSNAPSSPSNMSCTTAMALYAAICVPTPAPIDCDVDGRLKGVKIGSELWRQTIVTFPGHRCLDRGPNGVFISDIHGTKRISPFLAQAVSNTPSSPPTRPLYHGPISTCDGGDDFGGHLPRGFVCRGYGTGVGICLEAGGKRAIGYELPGMLGSYCQLDWIIFTNAQLQQWRTFIECDGSMPDCYHAAFGPRGQ
jgi:hypothetical protein